ncbi:MAG: AAA family ATPase [Caldilineaceae bacterium]|nr:AAA family ATPase [Caldilineaceae bacterium]
MPGLALTLFGAPRIELDGNPLCVERQKALALLAYLAVDGRPHRRDLLAALLWPESDQDHARASLRRVLSSLHGSLQHRWLSISDSIALPPVENLWVDVARFRHLLTTGLNSSDRLALLDEAVALYRGDFLSGFSLPDSPEFDEWQRATETDLRQDLCIALDQLSADYASRGNFIAAIRQARRWVRIDPLSEMAQRRLIEFYVQTGQHDAAYRQYEHSAHLINQEIGSVPALAMTDLYQAIHTGALPKIAISALPPEEQTSTLAHPTESSNSKERSPVAEDAQLHIRLFGGFMLAVGERPVILAGARLQALLAYLLLHRQSPSSRQHLAFLFWPDTDETQALSNLRNLLYKLRRTLPQIDPYIDADAQMIQWRDDLAFSLDIARFESLAVHSNDLPSLEEAAALYQGDLLPSCYDDWIQPIRSRLQQIAMRVFEQLLDLLEERRDYGRAVEYGQRWLQLDRLNESAYRRLIYFYTLKGDQAAALRVYHTCETTLQRELGVQPGPATQAIYERLWHMEAPPPPSTVAGDLPLIGREDEWRVLQRAWRNASNGRAQTVVLAGEAGIGKTRLAEELIPWVERQGFAVAVAHCYAAEGALAYAPMVAWLRSPTIRQALPSLDAVWLGETARLLPELLVTYPQLPPPSPLNEGWQRQRFFEALARALLHRGEPLLLFLDDLQWCDPDMLDWLHYLLRYDLQAPLLLLVAMRSEEVTADHPVNALLTALDRDSRLTEIVLGRLNAADTARVGSAVAGYSLPAEEAAQLHRETEGNPLFVVEMVRANRGRLSAPSSESASFVNAGDLPPKVHKVIHTRLLHLSSGARELVSLAATLGREFTSAVLAAASDLHEDDFVHHLDELWQRHILREKGNDSYDFSHDKLREVAYQSMSEAHRHLLHRRVAVALERGNPGVADADQGYDRISGQIAIHYESAGDIPKAIHYYQQAAESAQRLYANADAIRNYRRALSLLEKESARSPVDALAIYEKLGDLLFLTSQTEESTAIYQQAIPLAQGIDRARLHRKLGNVWRQQHRYGEAQAAYLMARSVLGDPLYGGDAKTEWYGAAWWQEWIHILLEIDLVYYWLGKVDDSARLLIELAPAVEQWGGYEARALFFQHRALMSFRRNRSVASDEAVADISAALAAQYAAGGGSTIRSFHFLLGFFILWHGEPDAAQIHMQTALRMAEEQGDISLQARCLTYLTIAARQLDAVDKVTALAARAFYIANCGGMPEYIALARAAECWLAWRAGDRSPAKQYGHAALSLWQQLPTNHASLPFKWTALWPLIDIASDEENLRAAIDYLHILAGADQQRLPDVLAARIDEILLAWRRGEQGTIRAQIESAIRLARQLRYL